MDWARIALLYERLAEVAPSPVVDLNAAVAIGFARGPRAGLEAIEAIEPAGVLDGYHPAHVARAEFLSRLGDVPGARRAYRAAIALTLNDGERAYLGRKLEALGRAPTD